VTAVFTVPATLDHWHDADTLVANLDLGWHVGLSKQPIRLARCDAPELATPAGKMALAYVRTLIQPGEKFTLVSHSRVRLERTLPTVWQLRGFDVPALAPVVSRGHVIVLEDVEYLCSSIVVDTCPDPTSRTSRRRRPTCTRGSGSCSAVSSRCCRATTRRRAGGSTTRGRAASRRGCTTS
jgi:hypothetical protein